MKRRLTLTIEYENGQQPYVMSLLPQLQTETISLLGSRAEPEPRVLNLMGIPCVITDLSIPDPATLSELDALTSRAIWGALSNAAKIEPALSAELWQSIESVLSYEEWEKELTEGTESLEALGAAFQDSPEKLIAILNHRLNDDDPRKVTRELVRDLRRIAESHPEHGSFAELVAIADALESYLPPETTT